MKKGDTSAEANEVKYDMFLSYSTDPDYRLASRIEAFLEGFHQQPYVKKEKLKHLRIFRDGSDLHTQLGGILTDQVENAVDRSRWLLILWSGLKGQTFNSKNLPWVDRELLRFRTTNKNAMIALAVGNEAPQSTADPGFYTQAQLDANLHTQIFYDFREFYGIKGPKVRNIEEEMIRLAADLHTGFAGGEKTREMSVGWVRARTKHLYQQKWIRGIICSLLLLSVFIAWQFRGKMIAKQVEAVHSAFGIAEGFFDPVGNHDPRSGFAHLAEALRHNESLPLGRQIPWLRKHAAQRVMNHGVVDPIPIFPPLLHSSSVESASFSPDGQRVVTVSKSFEREGAAYLWDATTGKSLGDAMLHQRTVNSANFSPDGQRVVTASDDRTAQIWDASNGMPLGKPLRHADEVTSASFSPDGLRIITVCDDHAARLWHGQDGSLIGEPLRHAKRVNSAVFSPDGLYVITSSDDETARIWDARDGKPLAKPLLHDGFVKGISFSPNGLQVATSTWDGNVFLWELPDGRSLGEPMVEKGQVEKNSFSPDGLRLITISDFGLVFLTELSNADSLGKNIIHGEDVVSAQFSPDGLRVITASNDKPKMGWSAQIWNAQISDEQSCEPIGPPLRHKDEVTSATFSPDGKLVITTSRDKTAQLWNAHSGKPMEWPMRHEGLITSASTSPDGKWIVTTSHDQTARLWDFQSGRPASDSLFHDDRVMCSCFSSDGQSFVTASRDGQIRHWDVRSGKMTGRPMQHESSVEKVCLSPNGRQLLTVDASGDSQLWEVASSKYLGKANDEHFDWFKTETGGGDQHLRLSGSSVTKECVVESDPMVHWKDLIHFAGLMVNNAGKPEDTPLLDRLIWRDKIIKSREAIWLRAALMRHDQDVPLLLSTIVLPPEIIERELTWMISHHNQTRNLQEGTYVPESWKKWVPPEILSNAYLQDPRHPLIHVAWAFTSEHQEARRFFIQYGLRCLVEFESKAQKAKHHEHPGSYRAKFAAMLVIRSDLPAKHNRVSSSNISNLKSTETQFLLDKAAEIYTPLVQRKEAEYALWKDTSLIQDLNDFEWPEEFRAALLRLATNKK